MSTTQENIAAIRAHLGQLTDEHAKCANEWLAITAAEKAIDDVEKTFRQRIDSDRE